MDFEERMKKAIDRGHRRNEEKAQEAQAKALSEEEFKRLHSKHRLQLSEHIESCVKTLPHHFPGFQVETIFGERGWGAACSRDDIRIKTRGRRENNYSRLEMTIRPFSSLHVVDLAARGTVNNKEVFNRNYFEEIEQADPEKFLELIDIWVLEYAEMYAAKKD